MSPTHSRLLIAALLLLSSSLHAQTQRGQIVGQVTDPSGSVVADASVELNSPTTGAKFQTTTSQNGSYTLPLLNYGKYDLRVSAAGFAPTTMTGVEVATATTTTANVVLSLKTVAEEVSVKANAVVIESTTSVIGAAIDEDLKRELPIPVSGGKRSAFQYIYTAPTVNSTGQLTIAGGRTNSHELLIDGQTADVQSSEIGSSGSLPSVEAIGEFKMVLNSMPAEYGRSSGGLTSFATKSGTNQYHGVGYWYLRNEKLDSRPWQGSSRNVRKQNEYGVAGGGPVKIPGLYNGENKTFFWANYTGYKDRQAAASGVLSLPTQGMRSGDFSAADLPQIFDRLDRFTDPQGNVRFRQFPGNRIPANRLSKVSTFFFDALPATNRPGSVNNFVGSSRGITNNHDFSIKADHNFSSNDRLAGFYQYSKVGVFGGSILGDAFGATSRNLNHRVRLDWNHIYKPNLIQQVILGVTRNPLSSASNNYGQEFGRKAGITGTLDPNCPETWIDYPSGFVICASQPGPLNATANTVTTANYSLLWLKGGHSMKYGAQMIRYNQNRKPFGGPFQASAAGTFTFGNPLGGSRAATSDTNNTGGNPWADFYLGWPQGAIVGAPQIVGNRETYLAFFVQDDWKVSSKLTLNLGLRWDLNIPYSEVQGRITGFDPGLANPGATGRLGALTFYGEGAGRNGSNQPGETRWRNVAPRLGLAYQLNPKTVFRGFVGLVYQGIQNANANFADRTGFFTQAAIPPRVDP
ncbi:MAG: TonB-dependent receptor, partial [Bryobacteraceae bacterium]